MAACVSSLLRTYTLQPPTYLILHPIASNNNNQVININYHYVKDHIISHEASNINSRIV